MVLSNIYDSRESWLRAATNELRPYFQLFGYTLPENIRFSISFPSSGARGNAGGECLNAEYSGDKHFEIIIRLDFDNPLEVLGILVHELIHTMLPFESQPHGKEFRQVATRLGLEGPMRSTSSGPLLTERLNAIVATIGPLPHRRYNYPTTFDKPKKQATRLLKAECDAACGYTIRLAAKWAKAGLPLCPLHPDHGILRCTIPEMDSANTPEPPKSGSDC